MGTLVPLLEHWWEAAFTPTTSPGAIPAMVTPARTPEEEAEGSQHNEEEEEWDQEAEKTEAKSPGTIEGHSISITIIGIRCRRSLT
jgi:hypothetical protein